MELEILNVEYEMFSITYCFKLWNMIPKTQRTMYPGDKRRWESGVCDLSSIRVISKFCDLRMPWDETVVVCKLELGRMVPERNKNMKK